MNPHFSHKSLYFFFFLLFLLNAVIVTQVYIINQLFVVADIIFDYNDRQYERVFFLSNQHGAGANSSCINWEIMILNFIKRKIRWNLFNGWRRDEEEEDEKYSKRNDPSIERTEMFDLDNLVDKIEKKVNERVSEWKEATPYIVYGASYGDKQTLIS